MNTFKRHMPTATDIHSLHVAFNRIWDAIEASGNQTKSETILRAVGGPAAVVSGSSSSPALAPHNALSGLQGGDTDNYWHLTNAEYTGNGTGVFVRTNSPSLTGNPTATTQLKADSSTRIANTAWVKLQGYQPQPANALSGEMTGFVDTENITVTYDSSARTITLTGSVEAYYQGIKIDALVSGWVSPAHTATNGPWYLMYDGSNFVWQTTLWTFEKLMIAYVNYGASDKFALRETHGLMPWRAHEEFHRTIGTYLESGADLSGYVLSSTTAADRRPAVSATYVRDEDIRTAVSALADNGPYTHLYLSGTGTSTFTTAASDIVSVTGSHPNYNQFSSPNWVETPMANNSYMTVWLVAVPAASDSGSQAYRYLWLPGQTNGLLVTQQAYQFSSMNLGQITSLFTEFVAVGKVIIKYQGGNWNIVSVEKITGTRLSNVTAPAGNYLSIVTASSPMTGVGTPASPLAIPYERFGTATIDFGTSPGSASASVAVTGQADIVAGSIVRVWVSRTTSADHTEEEHSFLPEYASFTSGSIVAGTGFTIYGRSAPGGIIGKWTINWSWI